MRCWLTDSGKPDVLTEPIERDQFAEIDVSSWLPAHEEMLGTKPKRWLQDPDTDTFWLMKDQTFNDRKDGSRYPKGDDWAELLAAEIGRVIGIPCAHVELAVGGPGSATPVGIISRSVVGEAESLNHGNEVLADIGIQGSHSHDRTGYTIEAVREALGEVEPAAEASDVSAWETFVGYLLLDALIGNTDRHQENWAVIASPSGRRLAPTFDHASSLGFQLNDTRRKEHLTTNDPSYTPEAYAARASSRFQDKPLLMDVATQALKTLPEERRSQLLERCRDIEALISPIRRVPLHRMSDSSKQFAERVLRGNHARLMSHAIGTL